MTTQGIFKLAKEVRAELSRKHHFRCLSLAEEISWTQYPKWAQPQAIAFLLP